MSYLEMVKKALNGRSVNAAAKQWGVPQTTLNKYARGERLPDYITAKIMASEAGISGSEMLDALAAEEAKMRKKLEKISEGFRSLLHTAKRYWIRLPATV